VAKKTIHHVDFETLVSVNREVVALTTEPHEYSAADGRKLRNLVKEVEQRADNQEYEEAVAEKACLLVYDIARGQYFRAGNKRTALVAGLAFLAKNGHTIDIENPELVATVDKAGIAAADFDDLHAVIEGLIKSSKADRKGWDGVIRGAVEGNRDFLTKLAS
jgi:death-on-curing family protein